MNILLNYADHKYHLIREFSNQMAMATRKGTGNGIDKITSLSPKDIDGDFRAKNKAILKRHYGAGYWLWKPYIISKTLDQMDEGDVLIYSDSDIFVIGSVLPLIDVLHESGQHVLGFTGGRLNDRHLTKRDAFKLMDCEAPMYTDTPHLFAGLILFQKTDTSAKFASEWLNYAQDKRLLTDARNTCGPNYPEFVQHRHDESIFSLLYKKYRFTPYRAPFLLKDMEDFPNSPYPKIFQISQMRIDPYKAFVHVVIPEFRSHFFSYSYILLKRLAKVVLRKNKE